MPLQLSTPVPGQALQHQPELRPAVVAKWLDGLRQLAPLDAASQIMGALVSLNRREMGDEARQTLTLLYQPVVQRQVKALIALLPENGTPQTQEHRPVAILAQELSVELSYAWKLVFLGIEQRLFAFGSGRARQAALGHLLVALSSLICTSYRIYTQPPASSWQELHQVFDALRSKIMPGAIDELMDGQSAILEVAYKRALLLALVGPFRFGRAEMEAVLMYVNQYSSLAQLVDMRSSHKADVHKGPGKNVFVIRPDADVACFQAVGADIDYALALETQELVRHLKRITRRLKAGEPLVGLGLPTAFCRIHALPLVERLLQSWSGTRSRGYKRYTPAAPSWMEMVCGVEEVHQLFGDANGDTANRPGLCERWRVLNDSASGLSIAASVREVSQIRLGDLVALRQAGSSGWMLGVIRWGKTAAGLTVEAGIEKLAPSATAVAIRLLPNKAQHVNAHQSQRRFSNSAEHALLIPANQILQISERLLLPSGLYAPDCEAEIWHAGEHRKLLLRGLIDQSPVFDLVEFVHYA